MKSLRDPQIISGFIYEEPVDEIPALTHCGEALCCHGHCRPSHAHVGYEFLYLCRGTCHWQASGSIYQQRMGDLFVAHPGEAHCTGSKPNPENRHLWLGLRLERFGPEAASLGREIRRRGIRLLSGCQEAEPLLNAIICQIMTLRPRRAEVVVSLLHSFVALVTQRLEIAASGNNEDSTTSVLPYSLPVQKAMAYMGKNLDRRIPLRELAAAATLRNTPHLCTLFHREVGVTPSYYHAQLRLDSSRNALRQSSATITDVALQYGFSSSQHFNTAFRAAFGITPGQWKNGHHPKRKTFRAHLGASSGRAG